MGWTHCGDRQKKRISGWRTEEEGAAAAAAVAVAVAVVVVVHTSILGEQSRAPVKPSIQSKFIPTLETKKTDTVRMAPGDGSEVPGLG